MYHRHLATRLKQFLHLSHSLLDQPNNTGTIPRSKRWSVCFAPSDGLLIMVLSIMLLFNHSIHYFSSSVLNIIDRINVTNHYQLLVIYIIVFKVCQAILIIDVVIIVNYYYNFVYYLRIDNLESINDRKWMIITWISKVKSYVLKYGKNVEFDQIGAKIDWNWIDILKLEKLL